MHIQLARTGTDRGIVQRSLVCVRAAHLLVEHGSIQQRRYRRGGKAVARHHGHVEFHPMLEVHRVVAGDHALLHRVEVRHAASLAQHLLHHGLRALFVEHAPQRLAIHGMHGFHHLRVGQHARRHAVARIERFLHRLQRAEDHRRLVEKNHAHPRLAHGINLAGAHRSRLHLALLEVRQHVLYRELTLRDAHRMHILAAAAGAVKHESQLLQIVIVVQTRLAQRVFQLLQLRRHHLPAQRHRRWRVLHDAVVDHHHLLNLMRNRRSRVRRQLRRRGKRQSAGQQRAQHRNIPYVESPQILPPEPHATPHRYMPSSIVLYTQFKSVLCLKFCSNQSPKESLALRPVLRSLQPAFQNLGSRIEPI